MADSTAILRSNFEVLLNRSKSLVFRNNLNLSQG
jgi:hypothetical protein